ncbi:hypothetical protein ACNQKP_06930 [Bdellovibrio bacteriovorus]|uniref:hypothetical protein n=1 Tax=Bdellovibrio bacteriovorus TaxID=959 RepID=UPI003AA83198
MTKVNLLFIALIAVVTVPVLGFFTYHWGFTVSDKMESWGQVGDFIGGTLNPAISILNLLALVYLTKIVQENEQIRTKENYKMSYKPIGVVYAYDFENCTHVELLNCGTGPLFINDVSAIKGGESRKNLLEHMPTLPKTMTWSNFLLSHNDIAIAPGRSIDILKIEYPSENRITSNIRKKIRLTLAECTLKITYCGISEESTQLLSKTFTNFSRHKAGT